MMRIRMMMAALTALVIGSAAAGEDVELLWVLQDGSTQTETRELEQNQAGVYSLTLKKEDLVAAKAKRLQITPDFARAEKGEKGYWFSPYGYYGEWDCDNGTFRAHGERMNMPMFGWATPRGAYLAIITSLAYYPREVVTVSKGEYRVSCELGYELLNRPYENFRIEFHERPVGTTYAQLAAIYREYQLARGVVKPLAERVKTNEVLRAAVEVPEIRIRQAWKPVPSPVAHQTPENEPEVKAVVTFDRVKDIVHEMKAQGVGGAELCLVGWNIGGHDGRWPQYFPAEPKLGGTEKLREAIACARENGYLIVPHGNFRCSYTVSDAWDGEFLIKGPDGEIRPDRNGKFRWGGGLPYVICPKRSYERHVLKDFPRLSALGFRGMGYFDVVSILHAPECCDPRHPLSYKSAAEYWARSAEVSKREFGGFASEGGVDHIAGSLDSVLYASFDSAEQIAKSHAKGGLAKTHVPIFQLVYNGIIVQNPFNYTVNFTAQPRHAYLKLLEYGGRPNFYFYSKFVSDGTDWMGKNDLGCETDEKLKWSVLKIKEGWELYTRTRHLQYAFMEDHEKLAEGVFRTTWSNGESIIVNYTDQPFVANGVTIGAEDWALVPRFLKATGVWPKGDTRRINDFVGFRTTFEAKKGERPLLRIAGNGVYRIYANGVFVGYGPARGPIGFFRVDNLDLSPFVKEGPVTLAIEVANYNVNNFYIPDHPSFLCAEVVANSRVLAATGVGGDFEALRLPKIQKTSRYSFQRGFSEAYRVNLDSTAWRTGAEIEARELEATPEVPLLIRRAAAPLFEVRALSVARTEAAYDSSAKVKTERFITLRDDGAKAVGGIGGFPVDQLEANAYFEGQRIRMASTEGVARKSAVLDAAHGSLVDVGLNDTGFIGFTLKCAKPGRLLITFDEILVDGKVDPARLRAGGAIIYDLAEPGVYQLENFEPNTMRYAHFFLKDGEGELSDVYFRTYKNAEAYATKFESSDPALDKVFRAAQETFAQNAVDVFTDCPSRERAGWLCDSFFTGRVNLLLTGSLKLETLFLENFALPKGFDVEEGMVPMCYPSDHPAGNYIPNWTMWFVVELEEYARRGGDPALIAKLRPRVEKLIQALWKYRNADGLLEKLNRWVFVEWSQANKLVQDVNYPSNMMWAEVLDCVDRLYSRPDLAAEAKRVRATVLRQSWNGKWFRDRALRQPDGTLKVTEDSTETCQYYAFFFRTATPESHPELWKTLVNDFGPRRYDPTDRKKMLSHPEIWPSNAFIGNYLRLELLSRAGLAKNIVDETRGFFLYMAERTGTLWEHDSVSASCNHGFASHAAILLVRDVVGLESIDYVRRTVRLRPPKLELGFCRVTLPTADGPLVAGWNLKNGQAIPELKLPEGWRAE